MKKEKSIQEMKQFGKVMAIAFFLLSFVFFWHQKPWAIYVLSVAVLFQCAAWFLPKILFPVERIWMKIGHGLGWVNTRILLTLVFFVMMTPLRLILLLFRKDILDQKLERARTSYWKARQVDFSPNYERLF
ncbi:MAG: hypothetical protein HY582_03840 [Candidatus Omnitrophica bacterium]|nr:hypothetical protein [Candidatus Omnitrophota bacterium]